jgi:16S rRNA (guanine1207-N2)-methyltransferase
MFDCDSRAVALARINLERNGLVGSVSLSAALANVPSSTYDVVLSNPPTHGGSSMLRPLFSDMLRVSRHCGYVAIVVRERLNYEKWFGSRASVERVATGGGFKVLRIERQSGR